MKTKPIVVGIIIIILLGLGYCYSTRESSIKQSPFVEVKELGITFTVPEDIKDLTYTIKTLNGGLGKAAYFSTESLSQIGGKYCTSAEGALGIVQVADINKVKGHEDELRLGSLIKTLGVTGVYYTHPQATCSESKTGIDLAMKQIASFQKSIKTVALIPAE
ncbi:MAG: hypothetical protein JWL80_224 [Parcubacteria group bacterium]|nr:hypothetical protein [Parcubacteria group bacterium]